eukprot:GILK01013869.1.p1 GENE.GILK01013869.1~~GILK01013869.1.p1  ORF type:complete len:153 (-),score=23.76 GILK01013869.1:101-559(-)
MDIKDPQAALVTNYEVLQTIVRAQALRAKKALDKPSKAPILSDQRTAELNVFSTKVIEYMQHSPASVETRGSIEKATAALDSQFKLTRLERLQIINLRPDKPVEVHMIVEECPERMTSQQVDDLIQCVTSVLPAPAPRLTATTSLSELAQTR